MFLEQRHLLRKTFTLRRGRNLLLSEIGYAASLLTRKPRVLSRLPARVMLEPTNTCNLRCPLCISGNGAMTRKRGFMDFELYKKIIDEVYQDSGLIILWSQGESFLHPDFFRMVEYAGSRGLYTFSSTNANTNFDAEELVASGLDSLLIAMDGATQETYEQYRVRGRLDKLVENVRAIVAAKKKLNSATPIMHVQFIIMRQNEHEIGRIEELSREMGVELLTYKSVQIYTPDDLKYLPSDEKYRRYAVEANAFRMKYGVKNRCRRLWYEPVVNWDGRLSPCCFDKDAEYIMGDLTKQSFAEIWRGKRMNGFRQEVLNHRAQFEMCTNCGEGIKLNIAQKEL